MYSDLRFIYDQGFLNGILALPVSVADSLIATANPHVSTVEMRANDMLKYLELT